MNFKVGDRVRRTGVALTKDVGLGELGEVARLAAGGRVEVNWARSGLAPYDQGDTRLEPADPAPAAAVERECIRPECRHAYAHTGDCSDREAQARGSQQAQVSPALRHYFNGVRVDEAGRVVHKCETCSKLDRISTDPSTSGDLKGELAALRSRCSELETDANFWKREAIRLKGGRR